jgi:hypothetical protein
MNNPEELDDLPLSGIIRPTSIYEMLQLPSTSDLTKVRKAFSKKVHFLEKQAQSSTDQSIERGYRDEIRLLEITFQEFSKSLQKNTQELFQVQEALKGLDLSQNDDWETIQDRYDKRGAEGDEQKKAAMEANFNVLKLKKDWFKKKLGLSSKTVYATLGILATAGVTIAALSQFSGGSLEDSVGNFIGNTPADPTAPLEATAGDNEIAISGQAEQLSGLDKYVNDNMAYEDELMSNMGLIPDIRETLSIKFKMQILKNKMKNI